MSQLEKIFAGILTRSNPDAGTSNPVVLIIKEDGGGSDNLHENFPSTPQDDFATGQCNVYSLNVVSRSIQTTLLNNNSVRVGIRGTDQWRPEHIFIWGERSSDNMILPVATETSIGTRLSTTTSEGQISLPIRLVNLGSPTTILRRLLMLVVTANGAFSGTNSRIRLQTGRFGGGVGVDFVIPDTPQREQEQGQANCYFVPVTVGFTRNSINGARLIIEGEDNWEPASFYLFGLDTTLSRPTFIVPLVHVESWPFGGMSTDSSEGVSFVDLPLI